MLQMCVKAVQEQACLRDITPGALHYSTTLPQLCRMCEHNFIEHKRYFTFFSTLDLLLWFVSMQFVEITVTNNV